MNIEFIVDAPPSVKTTDEANWILAQGFAPTHCWLVRLFRTPTPREAMVAIHTATARGDWLKHVGIS